MRSMVFQLFIEKPIRRRQETALCVPLYEELLKQCPNIFFQQRLFNYIKNTESIRY